MEIKKVLILGGGTMGLQIGIQCAISGFDVSVYDVNEESLKGGEKRLPKLARNLVAFGRFSQEDSDRGLKRISFTSDPEVAGKDADFINESIPEDPKLKGKVFAQFNEICPAHAIFTTNTSTLVPSMFADHTGRPEKFAALHFHDLSVTNVVDIMPHGGTSEDTLEIIRQFCEDIDHFPIELKKEQHGYVFNTMLSQLFASALTLASNGVTSVENIDKSWMGIMRTPLGPFGIMDSIGLETVWKVTDFWAETTNNDQGRRNAEFLKGYVDSKQLGIKTNKGFYEYPSPEYANPDFLKGIR